MFGSSSLAKLARKKNHCGRGMFRAFHTDAVVVADAALEDFKREVDRLLRDGEAEAARSLWRSVVQVMHKPWQMRNTSRPHGFPRMRVAPCMERYCSRCIQERGGFSVHGSMDKEALSAVPGELPWSGWAGNSKSTSPVGCKLGGGLCVAQVCRGVGPAGHGVPPGQGEWSPWTGDSQGDPCCVAYLSARFQCVARSRPLGPQSRSGNA